MISKEVLAAILTGIDEGIHVVDLNGNTIFYNEIASKHDGLNMDEVLGRPLLTVFPSLNEETSTLLKVMKTQKPIFNETQIYVNVHGIQIETINTTLPIKINGETVGAVEIAKDYSRLKLLSERLLDLQKKIRQPPRKRAINPNSTHYTLDSLMTINPLLTDIKREARKLAKSDAPILVFGESGCGKELFVQGIHHASKRATGPFIAQNCAAIPESLLESILFGTARGSYTGAVDRAGLFELADGGTLFLDEIHAMPIDLQAKLLRVLEDGHVRRVGSSTSSYVHVRVISAMNIHPQKALENHQIRSDLYYRLNVLMFELQPLRERKEDIHFLTENFIASYNIRLHKNIKGVDEQVKRHFHHYPWPGNVRELKHTIEYMMNVCEKSYLSENDLPVMMKQQKKSKHLNQKKQIRSLRENLQILERELIDEALKQADGNIQKAAKLLELPRQTLQYKLRRFRKLDAE